jgi:hypothetical protein
MWDDANVRDANWKQALPEKQDIDDLWATLGVEPVDPIAPTATELVRWLGDDRTKGGARLVCFFLSENSTLDWFASRNRLEEIDFASRFLSHTATRRLLPDMKITSPLACNTDRSLHGWHSRPALELPGQWATAAYTGGTRTSLLTLTADQRNDRARRALDLARRACGEIFEDRYADLVVHRSPDPWCAWFGGLLDDTWLVLDRATRRLWMLCITDVD